VLLTTFPGEQHALGMLMVENLLVPEGVQYISIGTHTTINDISNAAALGDQCRPFVHHSVVDASRLVVARLTRPEQAA
jgi:methanogenic corrinoid protein MtbC1